PLVYVTKHRILRVLIFTGILLGLCGLVGIFVWIIVPVFIDQGSQVIDRLPELIDQLQQSVDRLPFGQPVQLLEMLQSQISNIGSGLLSVPLTLVSAALDGIFMLVVTVYLLLEAPRIRRFALSLFPLEQRNTVSTVLNHIVESMGGYVRGMVLSGLIIGVITYLGLLIIGVDYPLLLGVLAGLLEVIPTLGPVIAAIPMVFFALQDSVTKAVITLVFVVLLQQLEGNIVVPNIMRTQVSVSPLAIVLAIFAGGAIAGLLGVLVAVPLIAGITVVIREVVVPAIQRRTGAARDPIDVGETTGEETVEEE
ncbi:MAG TPA: AI-2E family transporter, partial [Anaerolineaceae bacterium]|nr:AI-2E family transporter [Anaerolineaceae bacterium]